MGSRLMSNLYVSVRDGKWWWSVDVKWEFTLGQSPNVGQEVGKKNKRNERRRNNKKSRIRRGKRKLLERENTSHRSVGLCNTNLPPSFLLPRLPSKRLVAAAHAATLLCETDCEPERELCRRSGNGGVIAAAAATTIDEAIERESAAIERNPRFSFFFVVYMYVWPPSLSPPPFSLFPPLCFGVGYMFP